MKNAILTFIISILFLITSNFAFSQTMDVTSFQCYDNPTVPEPNTLLIGNNTDKTGIVSDLNDSKNDSILTKYMVYNDRYYWMVKQEDITLMLRVMPLSYVYYWADLYELTDTGKQKLLHTSLCVKI